MQLAYTLNALCHETETRKLRLGATMITQSIERLSIL